MAHVLATMRGAKLEDVQRQLKKDAAAHAAQGMYLEHLWRNGDDPDEVRFLFRVDDLDGCRVRTQKTHAQALRADPNTKLPTMTFLEEIPV